MVVVNRRSSSIRKPSVRSEPPAILVNTVKNGRRLRIERRRDGPMEYANGRAVNLYKMHWYVDDKEVTSSEYLAAQQPDE